MKVVLKREEILLVILDYLKQNNLLQSMRALEQESSLSVDQYGREIALIRGLILDGEWGDVERFLEPFGERQDFHRGRVLYQIRKQKFLELLDHQSLSPAVVELVDGLKELEDQCSREEFNQLCYCLTLPSLRQHPEYRTWSPAKGRMECFEMIRPHLEHVFREGESQRRLSGRMDPNRLTTLLKYAMIHQAIRAKREDASFAVEEALVHGTLLSDDILSESAAPASGALTSATSTLSDHELRPIAPLRASLLQRIENLERAQTARSATRQSLESNDQRGSELDNAILSAHLRDSSQRQPRRRAVAWEIPLDADLAALQAEEGRRAECSEVPAETPHEKREDRDASPLAHVSLRPHVDAARTVDQPATTNMQHSDRAGSPHNDSEKAAEPHADQGREAALDALASPFPLPSSSREPEAPLSRSTIAAYTHMQPYSMHEVASLHTGAAVRTVHATVYGCIIGNNAGEVRAMSSGRERWKLDRVHEGSIYDIHGAASGSVFATCSNDKTVKLFSADAEPAAPRLSHTLIGHTGTVRSVAMSPSATHLVSGGGGDCVVRVWDAERGETVSALPGHTGTVFAVELSADGNLVFSGGQDATVRVWDTRSWACVQSLAHGAGVVAAVSPNPSCTVVAAGYDDASVVCWDLRSRASICSFAHHRDAVRAVDFSPCGRWIATASFDQSVSIIDFRDQALAFASAAHGAKVTCATWSPVAPQLYTAGVDQCVRTWEPDPFQVGPGQAPS